MEPKNILKNITVLFAIIVLMSFVEYYSYYNNFGLYISSYNSPYELFFYFLPSLLLVPINTILKYWPYIFIPLVIYITIDFFNNFKILDYFKNILDRPYDYLVFDKQKSKKYFSKWKKIYFFISIPILFFTSLILIILLRNFFIVPDDEGIHICIAKYFTSPEGDYHPIFLIVFSLWMIILYINSYRFFKKYYKLRFKRFSFNIYFIIVTLFVFTSIKNLQRVDNLKDCERRKKQAIENSYEYYFGGDIDTLISTDSDIVDLGGTKDFIIIRDFKSGINYMYPTNKLKKIKIDRHLTYP